jgi:iron transport multicopper oxidase
MDGLRAPFIIHSAKNPYSADEDIIITLSDWYHNISTVNLAWYLSKQDLAGFEPVPQSALINDNKNTSFYFAPNKIYRIRLINVSGFASFLFHLDGHDLEVIAVDGVDTEKYPTKSVYLTAAQRVTVLVHTKNTADTNYYMHANTDVSMFNYISSNLIPNTTVPVYYNEDSSKFADIKDADSSKEFDDFNLVPLQVMDAADPDISFNMTVELGITSDGLNRGMFNRVPFIPSLTPTLYTALTTVKDALNPAIYGPQGNAYICKHLDMVQIVLNSFDNGVHPFHLHGHQFQIVARGINGPYNATGKNDVDWRLKNPCRRDTVQVPGNGFTIIRFRADNPGAWFFHCHIEWHLAAGLAAVIIEAPTVAQKRQSIPQYMTQKCADLGYYSSGNAAGRQGLNVTGAPSGIYLLPSNETA